MFFNDVNKKEEIRNIAIQDLKNLGIKYRCKKPRQHVQETKSRRVFKRPLHTLSMDTVTLPSGQQLVIPKIVNELCSFIITKIDTEGLFRKGGSKSRQNEMKLSLDAGCYLGEEHHEIDVASVLKTFFRELPEPLIPYSHHELFLRCMILEQRQREAVLLSCLLLPTEHLNTLNYFMQFLYRVSEYQHFNRMDSYNLAVVIGPTLLPAEEKIPHNATHRLAKTCELFKMLIENAGNIGILTESIIERMSLTCSSSTLNADDEVSAKKKKKRRSGSLTRMLSGLKKIVSSKSEDNAHTPDLLLTPCLTRSAKKRKVDTGGISNKKRREILNHLPQNAILNTPYSSARTPISSHPNAPSSCSNIKISNKQQNVKEKKMLWSHRSKTNKKQDEETTSVVSLGTNSLQRRWSAVSSAAGFRRKKSRSSCAGSLPHENKVIEKDPQIDNKINDLSEVITKQKVTEKNDPNYVRISKVEYEEIKNRVSAIERRISVELDNAMIIDSPDDTKNVIHNVEKAYEQTLVQAEALSPTTDQLAKRLSRELKIRRSSENKVFRSPSARKIGSQRRKSKEGQNQVRLSRNQTWCVTSLTPKTAMKIRKINTASSGLQHVQHLKQDTIEDEVFSQPNTTKSSFFNKDISSSPSIISSRSRSSSNVTNGSSASWKSAEGFFNTPDMPNPSLENCRASIAKLRNQNAGMVMAKARLFDNLVDSGNGSESKPNECVAPRGKVTKIGAPRNLDNRQSYRVRALRMEERRIGKKSMSPRKRTGRSPGNRVQKLQLSRYDCNSDKLSKDMKRIAPDLLSSQCLTPQAVPHIKKSLNPKSPRRVCRALISSELKQTPLKVIANTKQNY